MRWGLVALGALIAAACGGGGDGSSSGGSSSGDPDAGVIVGTPGDATFTLAAPADRTWLVQGATVDVTLKATRGALLTGPIDVKLTGLPSGVTPTQVTIPAGANEATVTLQAAADATQGPVKVSADGTSDKASASAPFDLFVRGKPGAVDTTFGDKGYATIAFNAPTAMATLTVMVDTSDRVYASFVCDKTSNNEKVCVARLDADGHPDTTYGTNGIATHLLLTPSWAVAYPNGRVVTMGGAVGAPLMVGFDANGALDGTFGSAGVATVSVGVDGLATKVMTGAIRPDGGLAVAFNFEKSGSSWYDVGIAIFDAGGHQVATYSNNRGYTYANWTTETATAMALVVRPNGHIFVGGESAYSFGAVQVDDIAGTFDSTFNASGQGPGVGRVVGGTSATYVTAAYGTSGAAVLPDGSVVLPLATDLAGNGLAKILPDGTLDATFNPQGLNSLTSAVAESTGTVLAASISLNPTTDPPRVRRFTAQGAPVTTFGQNGSAPIDVVGAMRLALQKDGRILVQAQDATTKPKIVRLWN